MNHWLIIALAQVLPIALLIYLYVRRKYRFWSDLGVKGPAPSLLTFGNVFQILGESPMKIEIDFLNKYGKVYGNFAGLQPILTVIDHELIKQILVKDFTQWVNRRKLSAYHELVNDNQFNAEGVHWKRLRAITGKMFTSGKLRGMHPMMANCIGKLSSYMENLATKGDGVLNTKQVMYGFTIDVIATTSFSVETNANDDRCQTNAFVTNAQNIVQINPFRLLSFFAMPRWFNDLIKVQHNFNVKCLEFFTNLGEEVLKQRKSGQQAQRSDFIQLLMDSYANDTELNDGDYDKLTADMAKDGSVSKHQFPIIGKSKSKLTDNEIVAQSFLFFVAGFETIASAISNAIYELARNADVQEKLNQEISNSLCNLEQNSDDEYLETVMTKMPYLEAVIKETLRMYPPAVRLERRLVSNRYKLGEIMLEKDQLIEIPTVAVHYNPEYYPQPERFNPLRFMPENKHLLVPYTYLPFGEGPRNCVGMRFAYQEVKLLLANIVPKFRFLPTPNTPTSPQFGLFKPMLYVKPFEVKVEQRCNL